MARGALPAQLTLAAPLLVCDASRCHPQTTCSQLSARVSAQLANEKAESVLRSSKAACVGSARFVVLMQPARAGSFEKGKFRACGKAVTSSNHLTTACTCDQWRQELFHGLKKISLKHETPWWAIQWVNNPPKLHLQKQENIPKKD